MIIFASSEQKYWIPLITEKESSNRNIKVLRNVNSNRKQGFMYNIWYLMSCHWMIIYMLFFVEIIMHAIPLRCVLFVKIREVMSSAGKLQYDWACNMSFHVFHQFLCFGFETSKYTFSPLFCGFCRPHFNSSHIKFFILHSTNNEPFVITRPWYPWNP